MVGQPNADLWIFKALELAHDVERELKGVAQNAPLRALWLNARDDAVEATRDLIALDMTAPNPITRVIELQQTIKRFTDICGMIRELIVRGDEAWTRHEELEPDAQEELQAFYAAQDNDA